MRIFIIFLIVTTALFSKTLLLQEDFETSISERWNVEAGWFQTTDPQTGSGILQSSGHSFIRHLDSFGDFNASFDLKFHDSNLTDNIFPTLHVNILVNGTARYFFGLMPGYTYLNKQLDATTFVNDLNSTECQYLIRDAYVHVDIIHSGNNVALYVDNVLISSYTDDTPIAEKGNFSFEGLNDEQVSIDNLQLYSNQDLEVAQPWVDLGGPIGGIGYDVRINPLNNDIMYVTDNHAGVGKSSDRGATWQRNNNGINIKGGPTGDSINIFSLTIDPNNPNILWAGTNGSGKTFGVFKSVDGGESWSTKINGVVLKELEEGLVVRGFTILEGDSNTVYMQTQIVTGNHGREFDKSKGRVYKTTDGGEHWSELLDVDSLTRYLIIDPQDSNTLYLSTGLFDVEAVNSNCTSDLTIAANRGGIGVLKSVDGGVNWSQINNGLGDLYVGTLRMDPKDHLVLYAGTGNNACSNGNQGLFKTTDGGLNWTEVISGYTVSAVNIDQNNTNIVYAGSVWGFFASKDAGNTWTKYTKSSGFGLGPDGIYSGFPIDLTIDPADSNTVYVNNYGGGVIKSSDGGASWTTWSKGISGATLNAIATNKNMPNRLYVIGRSGAYLSEGYGRDFQGITQESIVESIKITSSPVNPDIIFEANEFEGTIFKSSDGGKTFSRVLKHPSAGDGDVNARYGFKAISFSYANPDIIVAGLASERIKNDSSSTPKPTEGVALYISTDAGDTFTAKPSIIDTNSVNEIEFSRQSSDKYMVATSVGMFTTTDGGTSFTRSLDGKWIESLKSLSSGKMIAGVLFEGIYTSTDFGQTWQGPFTKGFSSATPYISSIAVDEEQNQTVVYAADYYSGVYKSVDEGETWSTFPDYFMSGLLNRAVTDLATVDGLVYAATDGGGVFRYGNPTTTTENNRTVLQLEPYWNLTALPVDMNVTLDTFNSATIVWRYADGAWSAYSYTLGDLLSQNQIGSLTTLHTGEGFWVHVAEDTNITFDTNASYSLFDVVNIPSLGSGWSMLGTSEDINSSSILQMNQNISIIWAYVNSGWRAISSSDALNTEIDRISDIQRLDIIPKAHGFWILIP